MTTMMIAVKIWKTGTMMTTSMMTAVKIWTTVNDDDHKNDDSSEDMDNRDDDDDYDDRGEDMDNRDDDDH